MQNLPKTAVAVSFVVLMVGGAGSLEAQSALTESIGVKRVALAAALTQLDSQTRIRVSHARMLTEGVFSGATESAVVVSNDKGSNSAILFDAIDGVWMRKTSAGKGAAMGATFGGLAIGGFGALLISGLCESSSGCSSDAFKAALVGGAIGAAGGAVIGGGLGWLVKRWVRIT